ncbi:MAG: M13 family metallopeptidase [Erythrobacter sp.]
MIKNLLAAGASALALTLATPAIAHKTFDESASGVSAAADAAPAAPVMVYGTWGIDPSTLDPAVDPGDDFFAFVNGKWVAENEIPADKSRYGAFDALDEDARKNVKLVVDELVAASHAPGSDGQRIVDAYRSFLDVEAIDAKGIAQAYPYLERIYSANSLEQLVALFADPAFASMVSAGVTVDSKAPDAHAVLLGFDGMGLPTRDYYLVDSEQNLAIRKAYKDYLEVLLGKAGYADPRAAAEAVYAFETKVARIEWSRVAMRNRDLTYNRLTPEELAAKAGDFPLQTLLDATGLSGQPFYLAAQIAPSEEEAAGLNLSKEMRDGVGEGLPGMMQLLARTDLATIKAYMAKSFLSDHAAVLSSELDDADFAFYGKVLSGRQQQEPRWKRAIETVEGQLGELLGKEYAARFFPPESKAAMQELVGNLKRAMAEGIEQNNWMTDATKAAALEKLRAFNTKIGYPDEFETYDGLAITGDALANRLAARAWNRKDSLSRLGKPVDKSEWFMLPQTVNAYYSPNFNEIVFPAAILNRPFFSLSNDPAVNYGAIGGVIGHEIGHGFDDQGSKSDAKGALRNWCADADRKAFDAKGDALAAQYSKFCPYDEGKTCSNGRLTLGENIGDVGGLSMAYRAYRMSLKGQEAPVIDGLTGDQRFFLAWAQVWRAMGREEDNRRRLGLGPHSLPEFRVNGPVRNHDAWYKAFNVTPDDALYLPPEERVRIW